MGTIKGLLHISTRREKNRGHLWAAVHDQRVVEFDFHGSHRVAEPFALGLTRQGRPDSESLLCYQTGRAGGGIKQEGWRVFPTSDIKDLKVSRVRFGGYRPGYDPDAIEMAEEYCHVSPPQPVTGKKDQRTVIPEVPDVKPLPAQPAPPAPVPADHNEAMRRFRHAHPKDKAGQAKSAPRPSPRTSRIENPASPPAIL